MREIKFRGRDIETGEWRIGDICHHDGVVSYVGQHPADGSMVIYDLRPETVGQFTGLLDKNGKEIYEGDVIKTKHDEICKVFYEERTSQFTTDSYFLWAITGHHGGEIIGNICENPELLEGAK